MQLTARQVGGALVVTQTGRATNQDNAGLREAMAGFETDGHRRIIIDFAQLEYIDSSALGELVACQVRAIRAGTPLKIANADKRIQDLLLLTRLTTVFESFETVGAAVASFD